MEEQPGAEDSGVQPELDGLLGRLQPGDVLVVPRLVSLARSLLDLVRTIQRVTAAGGGLRSLAEAPDTAPSRRTPPNGLQDEAAAALSRPNLHDATAGRSR